MNDGSAMVMFLLFNAIGFEHETITPAQVNGYHLNILRR